MTKWLDITFGIEDNLTYNNTGVLKQEQGHNRGTFYCIPVNCAFDQIHGICLYCMLNCEALQNCYCCNCCTKCGVHLWVPLKPFFGEELLFCFQLSKISICITYAALCFHVWLCHLALLEPSADVLLTYSRLPRLRYTYILQSNHAVSLPSNPYSNYNSCLYKLTNHVSVNQIKPHIGLRWKAFVVFLLSKV